MVDRALLHEVLRHVDQAAFALSDHVTERELAVAIAQLDEVRALVSTAAFDEVALPFVEVALRRASVVGAQDEGDEDGDGPALARRVRLHADLTAAAAGRGFTSLTCATWRIPAAATSTLVDLASELVSNAARHAGGPIDLALERLDEHLVVTVTDSSAEPPRLLPYRRGVSEQGIGLRLVDQLSESWGWSATPEGKSVWARTALPESPAPTHPARRLVAPRRPSAGARLASSRPASG